MSSLVIPEIAGLTDLWAKSPASGSTQGISLALHTAQVMERLRQLRELRPQLAEQVGSPGLWRQLYWAVFLHDWGKSATGFQERVKGRRSEPWGRRHEVLSLAFVPYVAPLGGDDARWIAAAIATHHKDLLDIRSKYPVLESEDLEDFVSEVPAEVLVTLWRWMRDCGVSWAETLGFSEVDPSAMPAQPETLLEFRERAPRDLKRLLLALGKMADDLERRPGIHVPALLLRGHLMNADHAGSADGDRRGLPGFGPVPLSTPQELLQTWGWNKPHPHQQACAEVQGSISLVAPTGSGKTESALLWASAQRPNEEMAPPRLFYILPYQASMNAMLERLTQVCGEGKVGLQHGRARHALYRRYFARDDDPRGAARDAAAERNLLRLNLPPVRVLSPYQLLKAFYRLRGYEAILTDAYGATFICDEIHAYEVKRLALILGMLGSLRRDFGGRFCVMSATFPTLLRNVLDEELGPLTPIAATAKTQQKFQRHRVQLLPGLLAGDPGLERIIQRANAGEGVLVCCNRISRAQQVAAVLRSKGVPAELLHGRFNARDRLRKEAVLRERMGTKATGTDRRVVMVATQVVEVSLDVDFDVLFTELAPLDALLQRFGRVNRGRRGGLRDVFVFSGPMEDRPYDQNLLQGAFDILQAAFHPEPAALDETKVNGWLDQIYASDLAERWEREYRVQRDMFQHAVLNELRAFQSDAALEEQFYQAFDGVEVLPASLADEYRRLADEQPLEAAQLLVPLRWSQLARLKRAGQAHQAAAENLWIVQAPYSFDQGLEL